jgi:hypothetical protein
MARPKADQLAHRCQGLNARGDRCGSAALPGGALCRAHLVGRAEVRKLDRVGDRLVRLTERALDRLEQIMDTGADDVAERAARTILDRTVPRPGPQHAVVVNLPGHGSAAAAEVGMTPSDVVRKRLAALRERTAALEAAAVEAPPGEIVDAVLVEPNEGVA